MSLSDTARNLLALADKAGRAMDVQDMARFIHACTPDTIESLARGYLEAERDAERYRVIRNDAINPRKLFAVQDEDAQMVGVESMLAGTELDVAIDAAQLYPVERAIIATACEQATTALAALTADAERYRWLRLHIDDNGHGKANLSVDIDIDYYDRGLSLDAAIDAAIATRRAG